MEVLTEKRIFKEDQFDEIVSMADEENSIQDIIEIFRDYEFPLDILEKLLNILVFRAFENGYLYAHKISTQVNRGAIKNLDSLH